MNEWKLQEALEDSDEPLTDKAIGSRLSRARRVERILRRDLDEIVSDDDLTYAALLALKADPAERGGNMQTPCAGITARSTAGTSRGSASAVRRGKSPLM